MIWASSQESGAICYGGIDATGKCNSSYDVDSRLLRQTDARGIVTTFTYDSQHRLLGKTYSDGTPKANYRYDTNTFLSGLALTNALGRRVAAWTDAGIGSITSYGAMGQVTTSYQCLPACQSFSTTYDGGGNALSLAYPNGFTMNYTYDTAGRIMSATDASGFVYAGTLRYFPSGALYILSRPHLYLENGLNNRLQPTYGYAGDNAGTSLFYKQYNYDTNGHNNGNLLSSVNVNDPTRNETFAYDGLNRLIQANEGVIWGDTYKFDPWGNLLSKVKAPGTTRSEDTSVSVDVRNRLATVQYDNSGNLASDGIHTYRHDAENRLIAFDSTTYTYDADGRRISKSGGPPHLYSPRREFPLGTPTTGGF